MASSAWPLIHAEREALFADLDRLPEPRRATRSLCAEWTVRDALAHMTATARMTPPRFFGKFIGSGFRNLLIGAKRRAEGLTLRATDLDWKAGSGPEVARPLASIILAITGRRAGLDDLSGDGVASLRGRVTG